MNASKATGLEKKGVARQPFSFLLAILENQLMLHACGNLLSPGGNGKRFYPMADKRKFTLHENCPKWKYFLGPKQSLKWMLKAD